MLWIDSTNSRWCDRNALVDAAGRRPLHLLLTPSKRADITQAGSLISGITDSAVIADRGFYASTMVQVIEAQGTTVIATLGLPCS